MLTDEGVVVEVAAFERKYHSGRKPKFCDLTKLGKIEHGGYFRRMWVFLIAIPKMRRVISRNDIVYAFGSDMAYFSIVSGFGLRKRVVLEVGDIRELQVSNHLGGHLIRMLDRFFIKRCGLLVVTSQKFATEYYQRILKVDIPAMVMENKIEQKLISVRDIVKKNPSGFTSDPLTDRPLRIGYFGLLRCKWSWDVLARLAEVQPNNVEIIFAGFAVVPVDLESKVRAFGNMFFRGEYKSPEGLPQLYYDVDLVWACYPRSEDGKNQGWARTNRFYESAFFAKPMISRAFSSDAEDILKYDIGYCVTNDRVDAVVEELLKIRPCDIQRWSHNVCTIPQEIYVYTDEASRLKRALQYLSEGRSLTNNVQNSQIGLIR